MGWLGVGHGEGSLRETWDWEGVEGMQPALRERRGMGGRQKPRPSGAFSEACLHSRAPAGRHGWWLALLCLPADGISLRPLLEMQPRESHVGLSCVFHLRVGGACRWSRRTRMQLEWAERWGGRHHVVGCGVVHSHLEMLKNPAALSLNLGAAPPWLAHRCGRAGEQGPATVYERSVSIRARWAVKDVGKVNFLMEMMVLSHIRRCWVGPWRVAVGTRLSDPVYQRPLLGTWDWSYSRAPSPVRFLLRCRWLPFTEWEPSPGLLFFCTSCSYCQCKVCKCAFPLWTWDLTWSLGWGQSWADRVGMQPEGPPLGMSWAGGPSWGAQKQ
ncbi:hypothetical protein Cadr_000006000 [Camelus dromedarius]|uniref:Uncharacterized protein n=1 Tax=Camelus dromedarius TaxID=9838 RepID=A0A5N4E2E7_CAMDR|nr:hypothetical protein Cadr_000006000 [Camelus dromedarius]